MPFGSMSRTNQQWIVAVSYKHQQWQLQHSKVIPDKFSITTMGGCCSKPAPRSNSIELQDRARLHKARPVQPRHASNSTVIHNPTLRHIEHGERFPEPVLKSPRAESRQHRGNFMTNSLSFMNLLRSGPEDGDGDSANTGRARKVRPT